MDNLTRTYGEEQNICAFGLLKDIIMEYGGGGHMREINDSTVLYG